MKRKISCLMGMILVFMMLVFSGCKEELPKVVFSGENRSSLMEKDTGLVRVDGNLAYLLLDETDIVNALTEIIGISDVATIQELKDPENLVAEQPGIAGAVYFNYEGLFKSSLDEDVKGSPAQMGGCIEIYHEEEGTTNAADRYKVLKAFGADAAHVGRIGNIIIRTADKLSLIDSVTVAQLIVFELRKVAEQNVVLSTKMSLEDLRALEEAVKPLTDDSVNWFDLLEKLQSQDGGTGSTADLIDRTLPDVSSDSDDEEHEYVGNEKSGKFHLPNCESVELMKDENRVDMTCTRQEAIDRGFEPCMNCNP